MDQCGQSTAGLPRQLLGGRAIGTTRPATTTLATRLDMLTKRVQMCLCSIDMANERVSILAESLHGPTPLDDRVNVKPSGVNMWPMARLEGSIDELESKAGALVVALTRLSGEPGDCGKGASRD